MSSLSPSNKSKGARLVSMTDKISQRTTHKLINSTGILIPLEKFIPLKSERINKKT